MTPVAGPYRLDFDEDGAAEFEAIIRDWRLRNVRLSRLNYEYAATPINASDVAIRDYYDAADHFEEGFRFDGTDEWSRVWYPQGLTGSSDSRSSGLVDGQRLVVVSSYAKSGGDISVLPDFDGPFRSCPKRGIRLTMVRLPETDEEAIRYCYILLVMPMRIKGEASFVAITTHDNADMGAVPAHAGGCVWFKDRLYVTDNDRLLVFDMAKIKRVSGPYYRWTVTTSEPVGSAADVRLARCRATAVIGRARRGSKISYHAYGYRYIAPLVGIYNVRVDPLPAGEPSLKDHFHVLGLDRTSRPMRLVSAKYIGEGYDTDANNSLLCFWDLHRSSGALITKTPRVPVVEASSSVLANELRVQGVHVRGSSVWLAKGGPDFIYPEGLSTLSYRVVASPAKTDYGEWPEYAEGLYGEAGSKAAPRDLLWNVCEGRGARVCFAVRRRSLTPSTVKDVVDTGGPPGVVELPGA